MKPVLQTLPIAVVLLTMTAPLARGQVGVGPVVGISLLDHTDRSASYGPVVDVATVGRSALIGAAIEQRIGERNMLSVEFLYGPYHNDIDSSCVNSVQRSADCVPQPVRSASHALVFDAQYARLLGQAAWRPYVGGGVGFKRYSFDTGDASMSPVLLATVGLRHGRSSAPIRVELTTVVMRSNPILHDKKQVELQARLLVPLFGSPGR